MNRAARRLSLFDRPTDYHVFMRVLEEATDRVKMRLLCYVIMPNHWHLVVWPHHDHELSDFMSWLTGTHSRRWHLSHNTRGTGTIYQGRYKAIAVKDDDHFLTVCRYVERNPVRAHLVDRVEQWRWSSAFPASPPPGPSLHAWPVPRPPDWTEYVNTEDVDRDLTQLRQGIRRSVPYGPATWRDDIARQLSWPAGLRLPGRPRFDESGKK